MNWNGLNRLLLGGILCGALLTAGKTHAEEEASQVLTAVSSTTISGYVDTEASFGSISMTLNPLGGRENNSYFDFRNLFGVGSRPVQTGNRGDSRITSSSLDRPLTSSGTTDTTPTEINDTPYPLFAGGADTFFAPSGAPNSPGLLPTSIPEPSTIALFLGGAGLLAFRLRRKA